MVKYGKEIVAAELVLSSLASGDMVLQKRHIPEEENIEETFKLLPELLEKSTELGLLTDLDEIDSQANTNDLKTVSAIFFKAENREIELNSV